MPFFILQGLQAELRLPGSGQRGKRSGQVVNVRQQPGIVAIRQRNRTRTDARCSLQQGEKLPLARAQQRFVLVTAAAGRAGLQETFAVGVENVRASALLQGFQQPLNPRTRVGDQPVVADQQGVAVQARQGAAVVVLPQGEPQGQRKTVSRLQRHGHRKGGPEHQQLLDIRKLRLPGGPGQSQPRILDYPGHSRIESRHNSRHLLPLLHSSRRLCCRG